MGTISDCLHLFVNLKKKNYFYVDSTTQRCPNIIFKTFLIEYFSFATGVNDTGGALSKKFETALMGFSRDWGKLIHEKKLDVENLVALSL
jgi:hypothetical protein